MTRGRSETVLRFAFVPGAVGYLAGELLALKPQATCVVLMVAGALFATRHRRHMSRPVPRPLQASPLAIVLSVLAVLWGVAGGVLPMGTSTWHVLAQAFGMGLLASSLAAASLPPYRRAGSPHADSRDSTAPPRF
jgi:protein-S-isoprenylcysteine O-methyltransferase Ste14